MHYKGTIRVLYVSTSLNYPIHRKRLAAFLQINKEIHAFGFNQNFDYPITEVVPCVADLEKQSEIFGTIYAGHYFRRAAQLLLSIPHMRIRARSVDLVYVVGFDGALLFRLGCILDGGKSRFVYEIHDIRQEC